MCEGAVIVHHSCCFLVAYVTEPRVIILSWTIFLSYWTWTFNLIVFYTVAVEYHEPWASAKVTVLFIYHQIWQISMISEQNQISEAYFPSISIINSFWHCQRPQRITGFAINCDNITIFQLYFLFLLGANGHTRCAKIIRKEDLSKFFYAWRLLQAACLRHLLIHVARFFPNFLWIFPFSAKMNNFCRIVRGCAWTDI